MYVLVAQYELDAFPTLIFFKKDDYTGAIYEGSYDDESNLVSFLNEQFGRGPKKTKVSNVK